MKFEENLTNEPLTKRFANQFELVRYAIARARNAILSGREPQVRCETQNLSARVLVEIGLGIDQFDTEGEEEEEEEEEIAPKPTSAKGETLNFDDEDDDEDEDIIDDEDIEVTAKNKKKP